ncbi:Pimeloyl-ACP methyl ester carboxylesterase [Arsukibacterium tuosuense]|uniref:Pimeloyl-ACP methyl ester carboxylesterase n=1 Tax=Arsukibacterium tuosuense TaxID=1323745 RepID=A0A285IT77_9GAMM|nr:alpha/beta hydrolase [Arsukibacterium tuosuense]SNY51184.1 Pimeloyl-ACP methyl ester carboxylesterase [Arsukibacterium tuosuense]
MDLIPWHYPTHYGFTLRGYHTTPSGKPVLHMLHGNGFCSRTYLPLLQHLNQHFDFFLSDAQGHGDSDHGGPFLGWNISADLAESALLAHQHLFADQPVIGVGHSFGGVLTALIHSKADSPFQQTILLDPVLFTPSMLALMRSLNGVGLYRKNPMAKAALRRRQHWPDKDTAHNYLNNRGMFKNWQPEALAAYIDHALVTTEQGIKLKCKPEREAEIFSSYPDKLWRQLSQPCPPTLIIYGKNSYPFIRSAVEKWQRRNPAVQSILTDGGHCFMQENPAATARLMLQHLDLSAG